MPSTITLMPKRDFLFGISVSKDGRAWQNCEILGLEILEDGFGIRLLFDISRNLLQTIAIATKHAKAIASTIFRPWNAADYAREKKSALDWRSVSITSNRERIVHMSEQ